MTKAKAIILGVLQDCLSNCLPAYCPRRLLTTRPSKVGPRISEEDQGGTRTEEHRQEYKRDVEEDSMESDEQSQGWSHCSAKAEQLDTRIWISMAMTE